MQSWKASAVVGARAGTSKGRLKSLALVVALFAAFVSWDTATADATVYGSNGCGASEYQPQMIGLACGDGKVRMKVDEWLTWGETEAVGTGQLEHSDLREPGMCQQTILACPFIESPATISLQRLVRCPSNGRLQYTRLRIDAPEDTDAELRLIERDLPCSDYRARVLRPHLTRTEAERFMRDALSRKPAFSYDIGYSRFVRCQIRQSRTHRRCEMSWYIGDTAYAGRGAIWLSDMTEYGANWNFAYRVTRYNEFCEYMTGRTKACRKLFVVR